MVRQIDDIDVLTDQIITVTLTSPPLYSGTYALVHLRENARPIRLMSGVARCRSSCRVLCVGLPVVASLGVDGCSTSTVAA